MKWTATPVIHGGSLLPSSGQAKQTVRSQGSFPPAPSIISIARVGPPDTSAPGASWHSVGAVSALQAAVPVNCSAKKASWARISRTHAAAPHHLTLQRHPEAPSSPPAHPLRRSLARTTALLGSLGRSWQRQRAAHRAGGPAGRPQEKGPTEGPGCATAGGSAPGAGRCTRPDGRLDTSIGPPDPRDPRGNSRPPSFFFSIAFSRTKENK